MQIHTANPTFDDPEGGLPSIYDTDRSKRSSPLKMLLKGTAVLGVGVAIGTAVTMSMRPGEATNIVETEFESTATSRTSVLAVGDGETLPTEGLNLIWSDEFDGATLDTSKWDHDLGDGCQYGWNICAWGHWERQFYTKDTKNIRVEDGNLNIQVLNDRPEPFPYSSAKIKTLGKFEFKYGRVVARMKMPTGITGMWPAFWMLPTPTGTPGAEPCDTTKQAACGDYGIWPLSGEIDLVEISNQQQTLTSAIHHGTTYPGNEYKVGMVKMSGGRTFDQDFHEFGLEWTPKEIRWYLDGKVYHTERHWYTRSEDEKYVSVPAPFDKPFHLILNLAVGGVGTDFTGNVREDMPSIKAAKPSLLVDYIRVYDSTNIPESTTVECGDFSCDAGETDTCATDCKYTDEVPVCGDNVCTAAEDVSVCPQDCKA